MLSAGLSAGVRERKSHGDRDALCRSTGRFGVDSLDARPRGGAHALRDRELPAVGGRQEGVAARGRRRHAVQQITLQVPANRLHLVSVDKQGVARLKLRPRFEMDERTRASFASTRAALRRAADDRRALSGRSEESRTGARLLCRARRPALEAERRRSRAPRNRRRGVPCRTRASAPSRIRRRRPSGATSSPIAGGCCSTSRPTRDRERRSRRRHTGASARISSEGRTQSSGPSRAARAARREEAVHRRVGCGEWHRRTEDAPGRRSASDGRSD